MPITITRQLVSPAEAADYLGVEVREVYRYVKSGRLPASRLSHKAIRIRLTDLDAFVESQRIAAIPEVQGKRAPASTRARQQERGSFDGDS